MHLRLLAGVCESGGMLESLSTRLQGVFKSLAGQARLTEATVDTALREIRLALLEADVNFRVVKAFVDRVRAKAVGDEVLKSLTPDQHVVRIVRDEMLALFGDAPGGLTPSTRTPRVSLSEALPTNGFSPASCSSGTTATRSQFSTFRPAGCAGGEVAWTT